MSNDEHFMRHAIAVAGGNPQHPFGAVLADPTCDGVLAKGLNRSGENPLFHGETETRFSFELKR